MPMSDEDSASDSESDEDNVAMDGGTSCEEIDDCCPCLLHICCLPSPYTSTCNQYSNVHVTLLIYNYFF